MNKKHNDIAEQILRIENQKQALLEKSLINHPQANSTLEQDKLNMSFFETLLPILREVSKEDILLCRTDISRVIFNYAYKGAAWKSLSDYSNTAKEDSLGKLKRKRSNDDDDCQILSCSIRSSYLKPNIPIKVEKKYIPTASERDIEHRNCNPEITLMRSGYDRWASPFRPPSNWYNHSYEQQMPHYPEQRYFQSIENQNSYGHGSIPRQIPVTLADSSNAVGLDHSRRINFKSRVTQPTTLSEAPNVNFVSSENIFPSQQEEFQNNKDNQSVARQIPATFSCESTEGNSVKTIHSSTIIQPTDTASQALIRTNNIVSSETLLCDTQTELLCNKEKFAPGFRKSVATVQFPINTSSSNDNLAIGSQTNDHDNKSV